MRERDFSIALAEWKLMRLPELVEREIEIPLEPSSIVAIVGPRQAGKTYRIFQLIKDLLKKGLPRENILYVNFEHERLRNLDANDLEDMMKVFYQLFSPRDQIYLFLDEVQNVKDWDRWVRRVYDSGKYRIYISGSSSRLSSREIATSLRGRSVDYPVFPFSFREFLRSKGFFLYSDVMGYLEERGRILGLLEEYLRFGGYPKVVLTEDQEEKRRILKSYYEAVFYRDLVERCKLDPELLDSFLRYSISCFSKQISISKIHNYLRSIGLRCSKATLIKFLRCAEQAYFLFPVEIFSYSIKERKQYPRKLYVVDNGIINVVYPESGIGGLMENAVAVEMLRRELEIFYWREYGKRDGAEVDFVVRDGIKVKKLVQVTYASSREDLNRREMRALLKASSELGCDDLLVITWDYEDEMEYEGRKVRFTPMWKWLLGI